jgi:tetratricopeptide (TPR) repeat protein
MFLQNPRDVSAMTGDTLSRQLERLEVLVGKLGMGLKPEEALEIPALFDEVETRLRTLDPESTGAKAVTAQLDMLGATFRKHLSAFLREIGDPERLDAARRQANPPAENWWWQPERLLAEERKTGVKNALRTLGIAAGIILVLVILYQTLLRPDPRVIAAMDARRETEQLIMVSADLAGALARVEQGLIEAPGDGELLVLKGCVLTLMGGREQEAATAFEESEKALGSREMMLLQRAQTFSILMQPELARQFAQEAIALNPQSAQGYLILGQALEDIKDLNGAYQAYEQASSLGMENNDPTSTAQARLKMGILLQSMNLFAPEQDSTLEPTP